MLITTEPFLSAELAYRRERMTNAIARSRGRRRPWLRRRASASGTAPRRTHRLFPAH